MPCSTILVEIVHDEDTPIRSQAGLGISQVTHSPVISQNDLLVRENRTIGIEQSGSDTVGIMAVAVNEKNPVIEKTQSIQPSFPGPTIGSEMCGTPSSGTNICVSLVKRRESSSSCTIHGSYEPPKG